MQSTKPYLSLIVLSLAALICPASLATANTSSLTTSRVIINNDGGGFIQPRLEEIAHYIREGTHVEIRGQYCNSSCTMYLGVPNVCIQPHTLFGFHGASAYGLFRLPTAEARRANELLAQHYPPPLRRWFLESAQHSIHRLHKIRGTQIIRMGVPQCP